MGAERGFHPCPQAVPCCQVLELWQDSAMLRASPVEASSGSPRPSASLQSMTWACAATGAALRTHWARPATTVSHPPLLVLYPSQGHVGSLRRAVAEGRRAACRQRATFARLLPPGRAAGRSRRPRGRRGGQAGPFPRATSAPRARGGGGGGERGSPHGELQVFYVASVADAGLRAASVPGGGGCVPLPDAAWHHCRETPHGVAFSNHCDLQCCTNGQGSLAW